MVYGITKGGGEEYECKSDWNHRTIVYTFSSPINGIYDGFQRFHPTDAFESAAFRLEARGNQKTMVTWKIELQIHFT